MKKQNNKVETAMYGVFGEEEIKTLVEQNDRLKKELALFKFERRSDESKIGIITGIMLSLYFNSDIKTSVKELNQDELIILNSIVDRYKWNKEAEKKRWERGLK